jgi:hypothetical protein
MRVFAGEMPFDAKSFDDFAHSIGAIVEENDRIVI